MQSKKTKIKAKLSAKAIKLKAKLGVAAKAIAQSAPLLAGLALAVAAGCQATPSRAQTQTIRDCTFYVMLPSRSHAPTNDMALAEAAGTAAVPPSVGDLFTQNQVVENSGTETLSPQHTISTPTQLSYGVGTGGGSTWGGIAAMFKAPSPTPTPTPAASADCADGSCTWPSAH